MPELDAPAAPDRRFDELRARIPRELVARSGAGLAVGVAAEGRVLWQEAFGWANREERLRADEHTLFSVASTSKAVTATAVMVLHEHGQIDIDAPVNHYLGAARLRVRAGEETDVTVRRVVAHCAGLPSYVQFFYEDEPHPCPSMEQTIMRYGVVTDPPALRFRYTNLGYGVLTHLVERVSGQTLADFLRTRVFLPLGMCRSAVGIDPALRHHQAVRYWPDGRPIPGYTFDHLGGSALYLSAHDLLRFGLFHLECPLPDQVPVLSHAALDDMQRPQITIQPGVLCGTGWWIREDHDGHRIVEHAGGMPGVGSDLILVPDKGIVIASVVNGHTSGLRNDVTREALRLLAPEYVGLLPRPEEKAPPEPPGPIQELEGHWSGSAVLPEREAAVALQVKPCGDVLSRVGDGLWSLVNDVAYRDGALSGRMPGAIDTADTRRSPHRLRLEVSLRGEELAGALVAESTHWNGRSYYTLPHWLRLTRSRAA